MQNYILHLQSEHPFVTFLRSDAEIMESLNSRQPLSIESMDKITKYFDEQPDIQETVQRYNKHPPVKCFMDVNQSEWRKALYIDMARHFIGEVLGGEYEEKSTLAEKIFPAEEYLGSKLA